MTIKTPVTSVKQCLDTVQGLADDLSELNSQERYDLFAARSYYLDNSAKFTDKQTLELFSKKSFLRNVSREVATELMEKCIAAKTCLPSVLDVWFVGKNYPVNIDSYFDLLVQADKSEHIAVFCQKAPDMVLDYYKENQTPTLSEKITQSNPAAIFYNQNWTDKQVGDFLKSQNMLDIQNGYLDNVSLSRENIILFCDLLAKEFIDKFKQDLGGCDTFKKLHDKIFKNHNFELEKFFNRMPVDFLTSFKRADSDLFNDVMKLKVEITNFDSKVSDYQVSLIQNLYLHVPFKRAADAREMVHLFKEEILAPVVEEFGVYMKKADFCEFVLKKRGSYDLSNLSPYIHETNLNSQQAFIAGYLSEMDNNPRIATTFIEGLNNIDKTVLSEYLDLVRHKLKPEMHKDIDRIILQGKLETELDKSYPQKMKKI